MDLATILTPLLTFLGVAIWDLIRTFWFARYTARLTAKQMIPQPVQCRAKLLTHRTHKNHVIVVD